MINQELRLRGVGASEVAAVVGMDPRRSAFDVYAEKTGILKRGEPTGRMRWGKRLERVIAECYAEETQQAIEWYDQTMQHEFRPWQVFSPDAFILKPERVGGLDCKNVAWDQAEQWGEPGTDTVPEHIALQCQWSCSGAGLPWWDLAALFGGNDLRVFRVHRDAQIEAVLLQTVQAFWETNVIACVPPVIESTNFAREYLKQRYPKNVEVMRPAKDTEQSMLREWLEVNEQFHQLEKRKDDLQVQICDRIGDADGLYFDPHEHGKIGRVTWKLSNEVEVAAHTRKATRRFDCRIVKAKLGSGHLLSAPEEKPAVAEAEREAAV